MHLRPSQIYTILPCIFAYVVTPFTEIHDSTIYFCLSSRSHYYNLKMTLFMHFNSHSSPCSLRSIYFSGTPARIYTIVNSNRRTWPEHFTIVKNTYWLPTQYILVRSFPYYSHLPHPTAFKYDFLIVIIWTLKLLQVI